MATRIRDKEWQELSQRKKAEVGYKCQQCGRDFSDARCELVLHHINGDSFDDSDSNLIVLCDDCHTKAHYGKKSLRRKGVLLPSFVQCRNCVFFDRGVCCLINEPRNEDKYRKCQSYKRRLVRSKL